jgi:hypothetical protein
VPTPKSSLTQADAYLLEQIASENSASMRRDVVAWIGRSPTRLAQVVALVLRGSRQQAQRASYPLSFAVEEQPKLGKPHVLELLENLSRADLHGAVVRNTMRLLRFVPLEPTYEGEMFSAAFAALVGPVEIAVKSDAISVLARLVQRYPEMRPEVELTIREGLAGATPAYRARARREFGIKDEV